MNLRAAAAATVAVFALGLPAVASASPMPDPPPRTAPTADAVDLAIAGHVQAYRGSPLAERRNIHNEIALLINLGRSAL